MGGSTGGEPPRSDLGPPYATRPLEWVEGIPRFSAAGDYTANYERIAADHLAAARTGCANPFIEEGLWMEAEDATRALVRRYAAEDAAVLDVGVGLGRLLAPLDGLRRYGMDIAFDYLRIAKEAGIEVCYALIEDMPYLPESFDLVVCTDVLEHVLDLNASVESILRVLKTDGHLIVRTPYREDLSGYVDPSYPYGYAHLRTFDEHSLGMIFNKVMGCEVVEHAFAGYSADVHRLIYRMPGFDRAVVKLASLSTRGRSPRRRAILKRLFRPVEMMMVFKKKSAPRERVTGRT